MNVRLTKEQKINILNSEDIYKIMQQILLRENKIGRSQEHFWVVGLNNKNKVLFIELISLGSTNAVIIKPRELFRMAIYKLATQVILVHNHPSGDVTPSEKDKDLTDRLLKSGDLLGIEVIDHLVISEEECFSFDGEGILQILKEGGMYELVEREKEELRQWKIQVEKEKAVKEFALNMAKKLKDLGHDNAAIKQITGLSMHDIKKL